MFHSLHQRETLLHLETALEGVEGTQGRWVRRARVAAPDRERRPRLAPRPLALGCGNRECDA